MITLEEDTDDIYLKFIWHMVVLFEFVACMFICVMFIVMEWYSTSIQLSENCNISIINRLTLLIVTAWLWNYVNDFRLSRLIYKFKICVPRIHYLILDFDNNADEIRNDVWSYVYAWLSYASNTFGDTDLQKSYWFKIQRWIPRIFLQIQNMNKIVL